MSKRTFRILLPLLLAGAGNPSAQELPGLPSSNEPNPPGPWTWFGDVQLRQDHVSDIPRLVDPSFTRTFGRGRFGVLYDPIPELEFGAAIKLADASNSNDLDRSYNVNERSNDVALDQFFMRWRVGENASVLLGKAEFPLQLAPLLWDDDLRPVGASGTLSFPVNEFDRLQLIGGYFTGNLMYGDDSRIGALQVAYHWRESAPVSGSVLVSYLAFSSLEQLTLQGLSRTNRRVGNQLVSDFDLLDVQLVGGVHAWDKPLEFRVDLVRNLGADDQRDGARFSVVLGDARRLQGWELGIADQRSQRDAVMAAFNSDDWWFHSWARGVMPWLAYGFNANWSARLAAFHERRDGVSEHTDRVLLDVHARW
jgi:hypothetical protein